MRFRIAPHDIMTCDECGIEYWYENSKVRKNDLELQKNIACPKLKKLTSKGELHCLKECFRK